MAADLIVEWIQRNLVLVTFRVMLLMMMMMVVVGVVDAIASMMQMMMVRVMVVVLVVGLETRRATLVLPEATSFCERTASLHDPGKVMRVCELLLVVILQVRRQLIAGAAPPLRR